MLTLDDDETDLALMALRFTADEVVAPVGNEAAKACVDGFCLPRLRALIGRIQQHKQDLAEEQADA